MALTLTTDQRGRVGVPRAKFEDSIGGRAPGPGDSDAARIGESNSTIEAAVPGNAPAATTSPRALHAVDRSRLREPKAADVIGLYLDPPQHAAVFAVDEKTAIQALDRLDPVLPLSPGRAERHGFEYLPPWHAVALRGAEHPDRRGPRPDRAAAHQCGLCRLPRDIVASQPRDARFTSSRTISRPIRRKRSAPSCSSTRTCSCISRRPIRPGSIKSNSGFRRSSATSWRAASLRPSPTWLARFVATSIATTKHRSRSAGAIATRRIELVGTSASTVH